VAGPRLQFERGGIQLHQILAVAESLDTSG
jgi:hypothetical protein